MSKIVVGKKFDFGDIILTEQEIIDFAKEFDPLPFHIDRELAEKTMFKGIIASGPHLLNYIHKKEWVPRFGHTVVCGTGISNWKFVKPVYPLQKIHAEVTVLAMKEDEKIGGTVISWLIEFKNVKGEIVQFLQMEVMHNSSLFSK